MDTLKFLRHVMPRGGIKILALPHEYQRDGETKTGWRYTTYQSFDAIAEAAQQFDDLGRTVYFAVQGFGDWYEKEINGVTKRKLRTQENAKFCRALIDDFDVGGGDGKYASRDDAKAGIAKFAKAVGIRPTVTSSGGGFHMYIPMSEDISPELWVRLSAMKRDITAHLGLLSDRAVDVDLARILRPVGTHNRKTTEPRLVRVVLEGPQYAPADVEAAFRKFIDENNVTPLQLPSTQSRPKLSNPFAAAVVEYPPSSAIKIVDRCMSMRNIAEAKGNVSEPVWRAMLGVVKRTVEGDAQCHEWSSGHPEYNPSETQVKIDNWTTGPTLCTTFDQHFGCAAECPHAGSITSPIQLGYLENAPSVEAAPEAPPAPNRQVPVIAGQEIPYWSDAFRWDGAYLSARSRDDDGNVVWTPFLRTFVYPTNRVRVADGTWSLVIRALERNGDWREFTIPTASLAALDTLATALASQEVFVMNNKYAKNNTAEYMKQLTENLQQLRIGTVTVDKLGWSDDLTSYLIGGDRITEDSETRVLCGAGVPDDIHNGAGVAGTLDEWKQNIDLFANRKGAEILQFAICHVFGAPLVKLYQSPTWHGLPLSLVGETGNAKTTLASIALTAFGKPSVFTSDSTSHGATINAALKRISVFNNLPLLYDELSGRTNDEILAIGYALANGRNKIRLTARGEFASLGAEWHTNSIVTANESMYSVLARIEDKQSAAEAAALRFFEIEVPATVIRDLNESGVTKTIVEQHLSGQYGLAGREFVRYVIRRRDWVARKLEEAVEAFSPKSKEESKERFYRTCIATAYVAGKIAKKLGLIGFDVDALAKWALKQTERMRESLAPMQYDAADTISQFVSSLYGRTIVTKHFHDGRINTQMREVPLEPLKADPVARAAIADRKFFVSSRAVADWCALKKIPPAALKHDLEKAGVLVRQYGNKPSCMQYLTRGTVLPGVLTRCYELNYEILMGTGVVMRLVGGTDVAPTKEPETVEGGE